MIKKDLLDIKRQRLKRKIKLPPLARKKRF